MSLVVTDVECRGGKGGGHCPDFFYFKKIFKYKKRWLIMKYDKWQQDILDAEGNVLANKGRQTGGTETFSHKSGEYMHDNPKHQIICVSDTLDMAENIINMVLAYLVKNYPKEIDRGKKKPTKTRVWLKNGAHIISRPVGTTGDAVRSFTGNILYVDEAALMPRSFWVAALAVLFSTGGKIWASSTPRSKYEGKNNKKTYYYESYLNLRKRWTIIEQTSEWVAENREICATWTQEQHDEALLFLEDRREDLSEAEYKREYMAEFTDENQQWFPDELIRSRMVAKRPTIIDEDWFVGMGNDIARKGLDEGSYEVFRLSGDRLIQIENQISEDQPITTTADQIIGLDDKFNIDHNFIDDEGALGKGVLDILLKEQKEWTRDTKTHGISNSKMVVDEEGKEIGIKKTEMHVKLLSMMEKGKIDLLDDESIFQSLKSVQYVYDTDSKGKRHLKIFGNDTHRCEGITRATELLKYKDLNPTVYSIKV
ncbi:MAG TPA: hypothetical protein ENI23_16585 [bacterium]|nr:hypothetical protein [bacterium]